MNKSILMISAVVSIVGFTMPLLAEEAIQWKQENHIAYYDETTQKKSDPYLKEKCYLNIEYPANRSGFATLIFFHGGGLREGTPWVPESYRKRNFAIVTPGYRLSPRVKCPVYIEDAAAATAWVLKNIARFGGNPNKVFISGGSGGGYLAAMVAMDGKYLGKYGLKPQHLAGVIPVSGQMTNHMTIKKERGIPFVRTIVDEYAPIYHVASNLPPFLVLVGDASLEWPARTQENAFFVAALKAAGHKKTTYYEVNGLNHGSICEGTAIQVNNFINSIGDELDRAKTPTTSLVDPKVPSPLTEEIEKDIEAKFANPYK
jgi:acetyl esterase/lipase